MLPTVQGDRPPYISFETIVVEDREATIKHGRYMTKNVDFVNITPIGSRDRIPKEVKEWLTGVEQQVREERIPAAWLQQWKAAYQAWKNGQEVPLNGTPIKGWALLSPAEQANVISANILTVEDLASANAEARGRIGMGAQTLVDKANVWIKSATDVGRVVEENHSLKLKVADLEYQIKVLQEKLDEQSVEA